MESKTTFIVIALALSSVPVAAAQWHAYGSTEPDTPYDGPTFMWPTAPTTGGRVYFNVISGSTTPVTSFGKPFVNPNVGALGTHNEPAGAEYHNALLGVWLDCNGDGYVGQAESALREYRSNLLLDDSICPPVTGTPNKWTPGAHNYNGLVTEFVPIGRNANLSADARIYRDDTARVWGDFHRPDERPSHRSCALNPQPRGTYQSSGGMMNYVDCRVDILGTWNGVVDPVGDPLGLRFADDDDARTGTLGQVPTLGSEDADHSAAYVVDCDGEPVFHSGNFFNGTPLGPSVPAAFQNTTVAGADPRVGDLEHASVAGTYNQTNEEVLGDCDTSNDWGHDTYEGLLNEADFNGVDPNNKIEADWNFGFTVSARGGLPLAAIPGGWSGPSGAQGDAGVGWGGSRWVSDSTWLSKPGPGVLKLDLGAGQVGLADAYWLSFYAHVDVGTLASRGLVFPGGSGVYGSWHCGDFVEGIHNGWNCDPTIWYTNPDGSVIEDPDAVLARPGWGYALRDVDCYDGEFEGTGLGIMPAFWGDNPCP